MAYRIYISSRCTRNQVASIGAKLAEAGFDPTGQCVWDSVGAFADTLRAGDCVVVHSLGVFCGSMELFAALRLFFEKTTTIHALKEAELALKITPSLIEALFETAIEDLFGQTTEKFRQIDPTKLGELARVEQLMQKEGVSVNEACRRSGCSRNLYYYYQRQIKMGLEPTEEPEPDPPTRKAHKNNSIWPELFV